MTAPLWLQYRGLAEAIASRYTLPGGDRDDVKQEALIGLWIAARDWRPDGGASFKTFADHVIRRHLSDCVKHALRQKHRPLNQALRDATDDDGNTVEFITLLPDLHQVTDEVEDRERLATVIHIIQHELSPLERCCVIGVANGLSYQQIGPVKAVDNALNRARIKLRDAA